MKINNLCIYPHSNTLLSSWTMAYSRKQRFYVLHEIEILAIDFWKSITEWKFAVIVKDNENSSRSWSGRNKQIYIMKCRCWLWYGDIRYNHFVLFSVYSIQWTCKYQKCEGVGWYALVTNGCTYSWIVNRLPWNLCRYREKPIGRDGLFGTDRRNIIILSKQRQSVLRWMPFAVATLPTYRWGLGPDVNINCCCDTLRLGGH